MTSHIRKGLSLLMMGVMVITLVACNLPSAVPVGQADPNQMATSVYETASAQMTAGAEQTAIAMLTEAAKPTNTGLPPTYTPVPPTETPAPPTETPLPPTETPTLTPSPEPTITPGGPTFTPTATAVPCNWAKFVADVTIPDWTTMAPGTVFKKTWKLKNIGTCAWTKNYAVVFADGERMGAPNVISLPADVAPGGEIEISLDMTAPTDTGKFQGNWLLRSDTNQVFGLGSQANKPFYVKIVVAKPEPKVIYTFVENMCQAEWTNGSGTKLACPGAIGSNEGAVVKSDTPDMENGKDDEPAIRVEPQHIDNGTINGKFPAMDVKKDDHFMAVIGCWAGNNNCNVKFTLYYSVDGSPMQPLASWTENYNGEIQKVDVDLSSLDGKKVVFVLSLSANGAYDQDSAFWLAPRITGWR
ncbi:MAG TPA: NBR1-Ig-like domain-containing protein [Anaerolineaceae bacterium]|nr:NBR1-Ig-like domain-containing protein [Anaerolineaceae bacterium]HPN50158.1 NBR1-Ig-like domain-containing protein [Anaerolineaceae bacterium]